MKQLIDIITERLKVNISGKEYGFCRVPKKDLSEKAIRMVTLASKYDAITKLLDKEITSGNYISDNARLAMALKIMMNTGIRVGNEDSAEGYMTNPHPNLKGKVEPSFVQTFGLTTLKPEHINIDGDKITLEFLGKRYVDNTFELEGDIAKQFKTFLNKYNGNTVFDITAYELTKYIKNMVGPEFTPKDFRMLRANMYAYEKFEEIAKRKQKPKTKTEYNNELKEITTFVSQHLNNTPGVCKKNYIDELLWNELLKKRYNK